MGNFVADVKNCWKNKEKVRFMRLVDGKTIDFRFCWWLICKYLSGLCFRLELKLLKSGWVRVDAQGRRIKK